MSKCMQILLIFLPLFGFVLIESCPHEQVSNTISNHTAGACDEPHFNCELIHLGNLKCFPKSWLCDGEKDCVNGEDEACEDNACDGPFEFRCESGACVLLSDRCDGMNDCFDKSDEADCSITEALEEQLMVRFDELRRL